MLKENYFKLLYPVEIKNSGEFIKILNSIGTDSGAFKYLSPKYKIINIYAEKIDFRAATFLKQELLARNGDAAVAKHVIDGKTDFSDVLLMGTISQLESLLIKLNSMDIWGLKNFREELSSTLKNLKIHEWKFNLNNNRQLILNENTQIMGIINLTPDSFFEDSRISNEKDLLKRVENFINDGAKIIDLGAESTRPNSEKINESEELKRLIPALKILRKNFPNIIISVDTYKSKVAEISINEGADIINDISGFEFDAEIPETISKLNVPYILSHIKSDSEPFKNLRSEIISYFRNKLNILEKAGVNLKNIILDPGLGFGKNPAENFYIVKNIDFLKIFGLPILIGHSRKRFLGKNNLPGTLAVSAFLNGKINLIRVHDVKENYDTLSAMQNIMNYEF